MAEKVSPGESAADIGTDHGYVPMLLIRGGISPYVIMSDISEGSLAKARETFRLAGFISSGNDPVLIDPGNNLPDSVNFVDGRYAKLSFRIGDGLDTIDNGEVDDIIIGGLGGLTIRDILDADIARSRSFSKLILQPRKHSGNLRHYLYTHGWDITDEDLAEEGKFVCEIITAVPSHGISCSETDNNACESGIRTAAYPENDIRWKYPAGIVKSSPELASRRIAWKIGSIREQLDNLSRSTSDQSTLEDRLREELSYLSGLLTMFES